jgi:methyl acetate hydrolase
MGTAIDGTAIDKVLRDAVDSGAVPHVAAIAASRDGVIYEGSAGLRAADESDPVTVNTLFRIMSMTKMPATVAALQQVEQGKLDLQAPVADYCPEFANLQVLAGFDGQTPRLRPPARQATVRNLITHTSGLGYWFWSEDLVRWEAATGTPNVVAGSSASLRAPLLRDPGEAFIYGINTDWLGKVIEAVTGVGLDVAVKEGVTGPLGMDQTTFLMNDDQRLNATPVHVKGEDGTWVSIGEVLNQAPDYWAGGHGMYGPPSDYIKFEQALLRGGELGGTRILQQSTVDEAFRNQIGDLPGRHPDRRPGIELHVPRRARVQVGLRAAAQHRRHPGHAARVVRRLGGAVQHPVLDRPHRRRLRLHLQQLPAVRDPRGRPAVQRFRKGALRRPLTRTPADSGVILQR